jgi:Tfp pilus assembly protein PilO
MPRNFSWPSIGNGAERSPRFWLQAVIGALALINVVALYLYFFPPGGSRRDLIAESEQIRREIQALQAKAVRLKTVSGKVQTGSSQASDFEAKYVLPERLAYGIVITEIQRMVKESGLTERDAAYSKEPIEGTPDLTLLTSSANYEGKYENLKKFLYELDHSPLLIMVDTIQAAPQQRGDQISTNIRFQTIIRDDAAGPMKGQP